MLLREFIKFRWKEIRKDTFLHNFNVLFQEIRQGVIVKIKISVERVDSIVSLINMQLNV